MFIRFILISLLFQSLLQVSWVRHRDIHLLTVGRYTYTSDQRFRAIHHPHSEDWILQIKYPQHRDSGIYECQVRDSIPTIIQLKTKFIAHVRWYLATASCLPVAVSNKTTTTTISNSLIYRWHCVSACHASTFNVNSVYGIHYTYIIKMSKIHWKFSKIILIIDDCQKKEFTSQQLNKFRMCGCCWTLCCFYLIVINLSIYQITTFSSWKYHE